MNSGLPIRINPKEVLNPNESCPVGLADLNWILNPNNSNYGFIRIQNLGLNRIDFLAICINQVENFFQIDSY